MQGSQGKERKGIVAGSFKELVEKGECQCHDYEDDSGSDLKKVNVMTEIIINITLIAMMMMRIMLIVLIIILRTMIRRIFFQREASSQARNNMERH